MVNLPWILMFLSLFSQVFKNSTQVVTFDTANAVRIMLTLMSMLLSLFFVFKNYGYFAKYARGCLRLLLVYSIACIVSAFFAVSPYYSLWKSIEVFADVLAVIAVVSAYDPTSKIVKLYDIAICFFVLLLLSTAAGVFFAPELALRHSPGIIPFFLECVYPPINANAIGFIAAIVSFSMCVRLINGFNISCRTFFYLLILILSFSIMLCAQSRTSVCAFMGALLIYAVVSNKKYLLLLMGIIVFSVMSFSAYSNLTKDYIRRGQNDQMWSSLSGRAYAWSVAWEKIKESPIIGNGFASVGRFDVLKGSAASSLHSSFVEVFAGAGLIGLIPWLLCIVLTLVRLSKVVFIKPDPEYEIYLLKSKEILCIMLMLVCRGLTGSSIALHYYGFLLFVIVVAFSGVVLQNVTQCEGSSVTTDR